MFWRRTWKKYSSEEKIRIVLEDLRGEESIAELRRLQPGVMQKVPIDKTLDPCLASLCQPGGDLFKAVVASPTVQEKHQALQGVECIRRLARQKLVKNA